MIAENKIEEGLILPQVEAIPVRDENDFYGASWLAAAYCSLDEPKKPMRGYWQHGWGPDWSLIHPQYILGTVNTAGKNDYYWVAKKIDESYLKARGYRRARAIGLPIVYLPSRKCERISGSLLVMPVHSLDYTTHSHWKFKEYANYIESVREQFSKVVICIHPSCIKKGYWIREFQSLGFDVVEGARISDQNSLSRIQTLMSSFEYVTTNGFGSHLVYAAYYGAKISISGQYAEIKIEDHQNTPFYIQFPEILPLVVSLLSEESVRKHFPDLFCHPKSACQKIEWAGYELGVDNKVSPLKMRRMFGWTIIDYALDYVKSRIKWRLDQMSAD